MTRVVSAARTWHRRRLMVAPLGTAFAVALLSYIVPVSGRASIAPSRQGLGEPRANECAAPRAGWIWCDDFEQDRLSKYFEYDSAGGRFVRTPGVGVAGSFGMRARWESAGRVEAGSLHLAMGKTPQKYVRPVDAGTKLYREVFWRLYLRLQPGWRGGGGDKLSRVMSLASTSWAEAMIAHVWSGTSPGPDQEYLALDPASGADPAGTLRTTKYNDFDRLRWLGYTRGKTRVFADTAAGRWYCVESHVRLNDVGESNGVFELWINGTLDAQKTSVNWVGAFTDYGINALFVENYWNAGAVQPEERYIDNVVLSTQRIGC
jgi:hypothetical protein